MATRPDFYPYENRVDDLQTTYRQAQRLLAAQVTAAIQKGDLSTAARRRAQLRKVLRVLDELGHETDRIARELVAQAHEEGAARALTQIHQLNISAPEIPGAFAGVSKEAVVTLQESVLGRLELARQTVGRSVNDVYGRAGRRVALRAVLGAAPSPREARRQLVTELMQDRDIARAVAQGGPGFVDKAGKRWSLETYSDMAVRTTTREAVVQGALNRMASHGITIARWTTHGDACPICQPWLGRLISLDGTTQEYRGEAVASIGASGTPPLHPNCRCTVSPVSTRVDDIRAGRGQQPPSPPPGGGGRGAGGWNLDTTGAPPRARPQLQRAVEAIESVHRVPAELADLEVRQVPRRGASTRTQGRFAWNRTTGASRMETRGTTTALTQVHELGHAIDYRHFGGGQDVHTRGAVRPRPSARVPGRAPGGMEDWWDAVTSSRAVQSLPSVNAPAAYRQYLLLSEELWARAYAQWIALRSGDATLMDEINAIRSGRSHGRVPASQWEDDDFEPIARALDELFRRHRLR